MRSRVLAPLRLAVLALLAVGTLAACSADDDNPGAGEADTRGREDIEEGELATNVTLTFDGADFSLDEFSVLVGADISLVFDNASDVEAGLQIEGVEGAEVEPRQGPFTEVLGFTVEEEGDYTYTCVACPGEPSGVMHAEAGTGA